MWIPLLVWRNIRNQRGSISSLTHSKAVFRASIAVCKEGALLLFLVQFIHFRRVFSNEGLKIGGSLDGESRYGRAFCFRLHSMSHVPRSDSARDT
jgi:hypothetical protein